MEIVKVETKEQIDFLYAQSALTIEGLSEDSIPDFMDYLKENTEVHRERVFVTKGSFMNEVFGLTGKNAYQDDLNIVSVALVDFAPGNIVTKRFEIGARWFYDIVDNNRRREMPMGR